MKNKKAWCIFLTIAVSVSLNLPAFAGETELIMDVETDSLLDLASEVWDLETEISDLETDMDLIDLDFTEETDSDSMGEEFILDIDEDWDEIETVDEETFFETEECEEKETREIWEDTMKAVVLTEDFSEDLLAIARTQIGYEQSWTDRIMDEEGNVLYYNRYAEWEGYSYGAWNTMFVDFCLDYAKIPMEILPSDIDMEKWIKLLKEKYLDMENQMYIPEEGDLVFFYAKSEEEQKKEGRPEPNRVGIVSGVDEQEDTIYVIEGDKDGEVVESEYALSDHNLLAYVSMKQAETEYDAMLHPEKYMNTESETELESETESETEEDAASESESESETETETEKESEELLDLEPETEEQVPAEQMDANGSGKIDINDIQWIYDMLQKQDAGELSKEEWEKYDLNGDGEFTNGDLYYLTDMMKVYQS